MVVSILGLWTWSLTQFTLGLTATKARKPRVAGTTQKKKRKDDVKKVNAGVTMQKFLLLFFFFFFFFWGGGGWMNKTCFARGDEKVIPFESKNSFEIFITIS